MDNRSLRITSFNCRGLKSSLKDIHEICNISDVVLLQETWLLPNELHLLSSVHPGFHARGISAVSIDDEVLRGRPYGGLAVLWRNSLDAFIEVRPVRDSNRLLPVTLKLPRMELFIVNVYMPCQNDSMYDEYMDTLGKLASLLNEADTHCMTAMGDFNASPGTPFFEELQRWSALQHMTLSSSALLGEDTCTYVSMAHATCSWLDHVICSADAHRMIRTMTVPEIPPSSDHAPVHANFVLPNGPTNENPDAHRSPPDAPPRRHRARWDRAGERDRARYLAETSHRLRAVRLPMQTIRCQDPQCRRADHMSAIDGLYASICAALRASSDATIQQSTGGEDSRQHVIPGWNDLVADAHATARNHYIVWRNSGRPRHGPEFLAMSITRRQFKLALRRCRVHEERLREEALARSLSQNDCKTFWKQISAANNARTPLPTTIDGHVGERAIANMWRSHFEGIMNSVRSTTHRREVEETLRADGPTSVQLTPADVERALKKMNKGKACGLDDIAAEHFIYADTVLCVLLSLFYNSMLIHAHLPSDFMYSAIVPIIKNKAGDTTSKSNYRPVAIVSACSKILEACIVHCIDHLLCTSDNQFGFKSAHSTDLCIFALKSVAHYYVDLGSPVSVCFLDASKAFDRVNHWTLFYKLLKRGIPVPIVRILCVWYQSQRICIRWGNVLSDSFTVCNGVRQGSLLSPKLFTIYIDDLSRLLSACSTGCYVNGMCANHLFYADDICLLAPSSNAMQHLLNICVSYGEQHDIVFNAQKSLHLVFKPRQFNARLPSIHLNNAALPLVDNAKYLGVFLQPNLKDDIDIQKQYSRLYVRCNTVLRKFRHCSVDVKRQLFLSYCTNFYCMPLWSDYNSCTFRKARVAYNNVFRSLFNYDRRCSASAMFVTNNVLNFESLIRKCTYDFRTRLLISQNELLRALSSSHYVQCNSIFIRWNANLYRN